MAEIPLAIVAGAGPGLGHALLSCFEAKGLRAIGLTRTPQNAADQACRVCDLSDRGAVSDVLTALIAEHGPPKVVVHNTASLVISPFLETSMKDFEACWRNMVLSAANLAEATLPAMVDAGGGTFIVSGATASLRGGAKFAAFASAKFALRGLAQSLAREFQPQGLHVVHSILDGIIDTPRSRALHALDPAKMMQVDALAEAYWQLTLQPPSVWTHELDLRPQSEAF